MGKDENLDKFESLDINLDDMDDFDFEKDAEELRKKADEPVNAANLSKATLSRLTKLDKNRIEKLIQKGIPDHVSDAYSRAESVYDEALKSFESNWSETKKELKVLGDTLDKIIPKEGLVRNLFSKVYEKEEERKAREELNQEEAERNRARGELTEAIGDLAQVQELQNKVNNVLNDKRTKSTNELLKHITANTGFVKDYTVEKTSKFQNKLLEIQIQSLFVLNDIRRMNKESTEILNTRLEALIHNTSLPDIIKQRMSFSQLKHEFSAKLRDSFLDNLVDGDKLKALKENVSNKISEGFDFFKTLITGVQTPLELVAMQREMARETGKSLNDAIADQVIGHAESGIMKRVGGRIAKIPIVNKLIGKFVSITDSPTTGLRRLANDVGDKTFVHSWASSALNHLADIFNVSDATKSANLSRVNLDDVAEFDFRTRITIQRTIPGYLRKIHAEINALRLGDKNLNITHRELRYDYKTDKFVTSRSMMRGVAKLAYKSSRGFGRTVNSMVNGKLFKELGIEAGEISDLDAKKLSNYFTRVLADKSITSVELLDAINNGELNADIGMSEEGYNAFVNRYKNTMADASKIYKITSLFDKTRKQVPSFHRIIEEMFKDGHADILVEQGILEMDDEGNLSVDHGKLDEYMWRAFRYKMTPEEKKSFLQKMKSKIGDTFKDIKALNPFKDGNWKKGYAWLKSKLKKGKGAVEESETYQALEKMGSKLYGKISLTASKIKGKAVAKYAPVADKVLNHPAVLSSMLAGKTAYNKAIDSVVNQLRDEIDAADKSKLIKDLKSGYNTLKKDYEEQIQPHVDEFINTKEAKKAKGLFRLFKRDVTESDTVLDAKEKYKNAEESLNKLSEHEYMKSLKEGFSKARSNTKEYLDKLRNAHSSKEAVSMVGDDLKANTEDTRAKFMKLKHTSDAVKALQEAAQSGDEAFLKQTYNSLKDLGLSGVKSIENAYKNGLKFMQAQRQQGKMAEKHLLTIRNPIDAMVAAFRLGKVLYNVTPVAGLLKTSWRIFKGIAAFERGLQTFVFGDKGWFPILSPLKGLWNMTGGKLHPNLQFERNESVTKYLSLSSLLGGGGRGLGTFLRNIPKLGSAAWDVASGAADLADGAARGIGVQLSNNTQYGAVMDGTSKIGKAFNKIMGVGADTIGGTFTGIADGYKGRAGITKNFLGGLFNTNFKGDDRGFLKRAYDSSIGRVFSGGKAIAEKAGEVAGNIKDATGGTIVGGLDYIYNLAGKGVDKIEDYIKDSDFADLIYSGKEIRDFKTKKEAQKALKEQEKRLKPIKQLNEYLKEGLIDKASATYKKILSSKDEKIIALADKYLKDLGMNSKELTSKTAEIKRSLKAKRDALLGKYNNVKGKVSKFIYGDKSIGSSEELETIQSEEYKNKLYEENLNSEIEKRNKSLDKIGRAESVIEELKKKRKDLDGKKLSRKEKKKLVEEYNNEIKKIEANIEKIRSKNVHSDEMLKETAYNKTRDELDKKEKTARALALQAHVATIANAGEDAMDFLVKFGESGELTDIRGLAIHKRLKAYMKRKLSTGVKKVGSFLWDIGKKVLQSPILLGLLGGLGVLSGGGGIGQALMTGAGILGGGYLVKKLVGKLFGAVGGKVKDVLKLGAKGLGKKLFGFGTLGATAGGLASKGKKLLGFGDDVASEMADVGSDAMDLKQEQKKATADRRKELKNNYKKDPIRAKQEAKLKVKGAGDKKKLGLVQKIKSKLTTLVSTVKDKIVKKLGPKAGKKVLQRLGGKVAARLVPGLGLALTFSDAVVIAGLLVTGYSLVGALCKHFLGFDATSDDPKETPVDENGNPILPDNEDVKKIEEEHIKKSKDYTSESDQLSSEMRNDLKEESSKNPLIQKVSARSNNETISSGFDISILKSNLSVAEKQLVVAMDSNKVLKEISNKLDNLAVIPNNVVNVNPRQDKRLDDAIRSKNITIDATTNTFNNTKSYSI